MFVQKLIWNSTRTPAFHSASSFFETNWKVTAFFFPNYRKFLEFETPTPRAKKVEQNPDPRGNGNVRIPGGWPGLEMTDT